MFGYATDLRSNTQGRGTFSMEFAKYEQVPSNVESEIVAKAGLNVCLEALFQADNCFNNLNIKTDFQLLKRKSVF